MVGGGIYGAWCAYDAALRGLRVALVEREDWAAGTSSASSKLIHGGLRYLEQFQFSLVHHALTERRILARIAPHLVRPMNFIVPVWRGARVGSFRLSAGLTLYDLLAWKRQPVQRHKHFRRERLRQRYPFLRAKGLKGGFRYGDCQEDDARLTLSVVRAAQAAGAVVANHCAVTDLDDGTARLHDRHGEQRFALQARHTVLAAGPWVGELLGEAAPRVKRVKGTHLILPAIPDCRSAFLLTAPQDGRVFFVIPWYGRTLLGTTESIVDHPDQAVPTDAEADYLLAAVNEWMPQLGWGRGDVIGRFAGTRTLQDAGGDNLNSATREFAILSPRPGLTVPVGGKLTTARHDASRVIDVACRVLGVSVKCTTDRHPLPGAPDGDFVEFLERQTAALLAAGLDEECANQCALRFGSFTDTLVAMLAENPDWACRLAPELPFARVEQEFARRHEMALTDDDVQRRRVPLAILAP